MDRLGVEQIVTLPGVEHIWQDRKLGPDWRTRKRSRDYKGTYSLFVPALQYDELKKFVAQIKPTQAVGIGGKKLAVSARFPFPHETEWRPVVSK